MSKKEYGGVLPLPVPSSQAEKLLSKSAAGVTFLVVGQAFTKICTFVLNQVLITYISAETFGINAFLEFIINTALFFSREGIRLSAQRIHIEDNDDADEIDDEKTKDKYNHNKTLHGTKLANLQSLINISYIPLGLGFVCSSLLIVWRYGSISDTYKNMELFRSSLIVVWFAIMVELFSEPFYILNQYNLNYDKRAKFEGVSLTLCCFVNFGIVYWYKDQKIDGLAVLAFAIGKLTHSTFLFLFYLVDFAKYKRALNKENGHRKLHLRLTKIYVDGNTTYYFEPNVISHFFKIYLNLILKHILTEGDKLVINSLCSIEEQGIYSLISNYGSLLARLVFAPIEESLRNFLTRLLLENKSVKNVKLSITILQRIISFYLYLSIIISIFGPLNSGYLIQKVIGNNWSNAVSDTIPTYTLYLPLLALNGILEAVHQSTASGNEVVEYTFYMFLFSLFFAFSSFVSIKWLDLSLHGLILSNMVSMVFRIVYCYGFIGRYYKANNAVFKLLEVDADTKRILIWSFVVWVCDVLLFGVTRNLKELFGNVVFAGALGSFILYKEKELILSIIKKKPLDKEEKTIR